MIESVVREASAQGYGLAVQFAELVNAILSNGLGRYEEALGSARRAAEEMPQLFISGLALPELIEAAARSGRPELAHDALEHLTEVTTAAGTPWSGSRRGRGHSSPKARLPASSTSRRSICSAARGCAPILPAPTSSTASGCDARSGGPTLVNTCARRTSI